MIRKNKILSGAIAAAIALLGIPVGALADTPNNGDVTAVQSSNEETVDTSVTTGSAVTIDNSNNSNTQEDSSGIETIYFNNQYDKAEKALDNIKVSNSTSENNILNIIKNDVDSSINVSFVEGTFNKNEASITNEGKITGTIILQSEDKSKNLDVDLSIGKLNNDQVQQVDQEVTTTDAAATVNNTTGAAVIAVDENEPTSLKTEIEGNPVLGETMEDEVTAYNAEGKEVQIDEKNITYEWEANGKDVGNQKELLITQEMNGEKIDCIVNYDDGKEEK